MSYNPDAKSELNRLDRLTVIVLIVPREDIDRARHQNRRMSLVVNCVIGTRTGVGLRAYLERSFPWLFNGMRIV